MNQITICPHCNEDFETYNGDELHREYVGSIRCPECGTLTDMDIDSFNKHIQNNPFIGSKEIDEIIQFLERNEGKYLFVATDSNVRETFESWGDLICTLSGWYEWMVDISIEDYDYVLADAISEMTSIEEDIEELDVVGLNHNIAQVIANIETTMHKQHSGMDLTVSVESNALYLDGVLKMNNALQPQ
jgi:hypothetical protein